VEPVEATVPEARCHAFLSGRVQGVGFRYFVVDAANTIGAVGWVRNLRDGRVEFIAEGSRAGLESLLSQLRRGSPGRVDHIEEAWEPPAGQFRDFVVQRTA
jgi:acylphosphatase